VSGLNGLGAEIAKNIILAQLGHVTLHDEAAACAADLGAHFYLDEGDVGAAKNRAAACVARLQELNPTVKVHASSAALSETLVWAHDIVVLVGHSRAVAEQVSAWSRERKPAPARVIWTSVNGLFGFVCNDFGAEFVVNDATGENPRTAIVASIVQNETETLVSCVDDERIDFEEGDIVRLHEVEGMHGVHDVDFVVKDVQKSSFKIGPTTQFAPYVSGGTVVQQKQPKLLQFASIADAFRAPKGELLETDFAKFGRARLLLLAYEALEALRDENAQALPALNDVAAAKRIVELAAELNAKRAEADRVDGLADAANVAIVQQLALTARAVLNPMAAFFGGIAGQEVVKAATGKFHPIHQWLLFESLESAPDFNIEARADFVAPASSRYTDQIAVFGNSLQAKLADLK
jgi:ubiquitin-activating enzyme E1